MRAHGHDPRQQRWQDSLLCVQTVTFEEAAKAIEKLHSELLFGDDFDPGLLDEEEEQLMLAALDHLCVAQRMMKLAAIKEKRRKINSLGDIYK